MAFRHASQRFLIILAFILSVFFCNGCGATTVIFIFNRDAAILAADSLLTTPTHSENWNICKITVTNDTVWSITGIIDTNEIPGIDFDVPRITASILSESQPIADRIVKLENDILSKLSIMIVKLRNESPGDLRYLILSHARTNLIFFTFNGSDIKMFYRAFVIKEAGSTIEKLDCPGPGCHELQFGALGNNEIAYRMYDDGIFKTDKIVPAIEKMIVAERDHSPSTVGLPISIASISKNGVHWISNGMCGAQH